MPNITFNPAAAGFSSGGDWGAVGNGMDYAGAFSGLDNVVHAYSNNNGGYDVTQSNGDPNYTRQGSFTVNPDGSVSQVGDWGGYTKPDSVGSNILQGAILGGGLALGAGAFLGSGMAGAGAGAGTFNAAADSQAASSALGYTGADMAGAGGAAAVPAGAAESASPFVWNGAADSQLASSQLGYTGAEMGAIPTAPAIPVNGGGGVPWQNIADTAKKLLPGQQPQPGQPQPGQRPGAGNGSGAALLALSQALLSGPMRNEGLLTSRRQHEQAIANALMSRDQNGL